MTFSEYIFSVISSASIASIIAYIVQTVVSERIKQSVKSEYDKKTEDFKARVKSEYDHALEEYKAILKGKNDTSLAELKGKIDLSLKERDIKLSSSFLHTVESIKETYENLTYFYDACKDYTNFITHSGTPSLKDRRRVVVETFQELSKCYKPRKPFLPKSIVEQLDELTKKLLDNVEKFMLDIEEEGEMKRIISGKQDDSKSWEEVSKSILEETPILLKELEETLRSYLEINFETKS